MVIGLFLVLRIVLVGVGVMRDVTQSELDKGPDGGALDGTLRPVSRKGLRKGLPWYVVGGLLSALAVLLS